MADAIREAVDSLPTPQKQVVILFMEEDLSYQEISDVLDYSLSNVKTRTQAVCGWTSRKWNARVLPPGSAEPQLGQLPFSPENAGVPFAGGAEFWKTMMFRARAALKEKLKEWRT